MPLPILADVGHALAHTVSARLAGTLMAEALQHVASGTLTRTPQPTEGNTYKVMPPDLLAEVRAKLANGSYKHFVD